MKISFLITAIIFFTACAPKTDNAKIYFLTGDVKVNQQAAEVDLEILNGSIIETGNNSICEIIFNEKNALRLRENTKIIFDFSKLEIKSGSLIGVLKKLTKGKKPFTVKTPHNLAAIRGTSFFTKIESKNSTYLCDCNGVIDVSSVDRSNKKTLRSSHHHAVRITKNGKITKAKMLYHSDQDVEKAASCINYRIDWSKVSE